MEIIPDANPFDKIPPHSIEAEMCLIASLLLCDGDHKTFADTEAIVGRQMFYLADHQIYWDIITAMKENGTAIDAVTAREELRRRNLYEEVGGDAYLGELLSKVPSAAHYMHYAKIIVAKSKWRELVRISNDALRSVYAPNDSKDDGEAADEALADFADSAMRIAVTGKASQVFSMSDIVSDFMEAKDQKKAIALLSGVRSLDEFCGIFAFGKYTIVGGRPSMGKSSLVRWLLEVWAREGSSVGLVAVEEDRQKIAGNYLSSVSGIENSIIAYKELTGEESAEVVRAANSLAGYNWHGVDTAFSISEVCNAVEILAVEKNCRVVAVDHLHLISSDRHYESEQRELKEISRRLKEIGKRHQIVLIVAVQLSRPEKIRIPPPPTMTDVRMCGGIEEHADAMLLLHREDYYRRDVKPTHMCEIIVAKNRNGRTGTTALFEELRCQRFREPNSMEASEWQHEGIVNEPIEETMAAAAAGNLAKRLASLFRGQFTAAQVFVVSGAFREMKGSVANALVDATYKAGGRIDHQAFLQLCKERI